jgi:hypothetical protein
MPRLQRLWPPETGRDFHRYLPYIYEICETQAHRQGNFCRLLEDYYENLKLKAITMKIKKLNLQNGLLKNTTGILLFCS